MFENRILFFFYFDKKKKYNKKYNFIFSLSKKK